MTSERLPEGLTVFTPTPLAITYKYARGLPTSSNNPTSFFSIYTHILFTTANMSANDSHNSVPSTNDSYNPGKQHEHHHHQQLQPHADQKQDVSPTPSGRSSEYEYYDSDTPSSGGFAMPMAYPYQHQHDGATQGQVHLAPPPQGGSNLEFYDQKLPEERQRGEYPAGGVPGRAGPDGEKGLGSTVLGGAAGAFFGDKVGLGKLGGAAAVSFFCFFVFWLRCGYFEADVIFVFREL